MSTMDLISQAEAYIREHFAHNSDGHDAEHSLRVYRNAMAIASEEECDMEVVALASLLHDADDKKLFDTKGNSNARQFLSSHGVPEDKCERIIEVVNGVSYSSNKDSIPSVIEGKIVQDADRLDAIGAVGIARTFMYGGSHGRSIEETREHFEDKLLLLKDKMNTDTAKKIASVRHEYLLSFLEELDSELS